MRRWRSRLAIWWRRLRRKIDCINTGKADLRYLGHFQRRRSEVVDYPDSNKVGVTAGVKNGDFKTASFLGMGRLEKADYYDGEDK